MAEADFSGRVIEIHSREFPGARRRWFEGTLLGLRTAEFAALSVFITVAAVASFCHEPWSDEAQAWLIARDLSIPRILGVMTYEGSPPLWHLLLKALIRLHLPYSALGAVSVTLMSGAVYMWLRWSPLPRLLRWTVPFAFYFQYQYAVVARSYALSIFLAFAAACLWRDGVRRIVPLAVVLALLAQTNLYGFVMAAGLALAFACEYWHEFHPNKPTTSLSGTPAFHPNKPTTGLSGTPAFHPKIRDDDGRRRLSNPTSQQQACRGLWRRRIEIVVALAVLAASCLMAAALAKPPADSSSAAGTTLNTQMKTADVFSVASRALSGRQTLYLSLGLRSSWKVVALILLVVWAISVKNRIHYGLPLVFTALAVWQGTTLTLVWEAGLLLLLLFWFLRVGKIHCASPFVFTMISMGLIRSVHQHYGMTLAALVISLWIAWPERLLTQSSENHTGILQAALGLALVLQLPATLAAVVHEVEEPYSGAAAAAEYIRPFVGKRPIYGFSFFPVALQPYFEHNIYVNQTEAAWIWSKGYEMSVKAPLLASIEKDAMAVVVSAGNPNGPMVHPLDTLLLRQQMRKTYAFCGKRFWFETQSDAECFDIYEKQP